MTRAALNLNPDDYRAPETLRRLGSRALFVGLAGAAALVSGAVLDPHSFYPAYLVGWLLWYTVASGCLGLLLLHHLSGGRWGIVLRRPMEAGARTLPAVALLALPLLLGIDHLYLWADRAKVAADPLLQHKASYLNPTAFTIRFVIVMALFSLYAHLLSGKSAAQDLAGDRGQAHSMQKTSAIGLLLFVIATSFVGIDWVMSLDPHWFSSLYGAIFLSGSAVAALAFLILIANLLVQRPPMAAVYTSKRFHDFGTLLFAFVMFFTYLTLSQFIIAYQGNLPEEVVWFKDRFNGSWGYLAFGLLIFHFLFPFLVLLQRSVKRRAKMLAAIAAFMLCMRWLDLFWQTRPSLGHGAEPTGVHLSWLDLVAPIGVGGLWIFLFVRELSRRALVPIHDPSLPEAFGHE